MDIRIDRHAAIDTIIVGLAKRLREIQATEDELVYTITEVLQGALKPTDAWDCVNSTKYLKVLRKADLEAQAAVVEQYDEKPCKCCCKFEIKDGDKVESFKELEQRYLRQYLTPYYEPPWYARPVGEPHPTVVDSPIREVAQEIINQVNEAHNDSNAADS